VCDRDVPNLDATVDAIAAEGRRVVAQELDVRDGDGVRAFLDVVAGEFGHVDILVNNAGGGSTRSSST
jgi:NAD(P)-dependent dehydrogenase (short-subunit alcohol dehydrogenase family)